MTNERDPQILASIPRPLLKRARIFRRPLGPLRSEEKPEQVAPSLVLGLDRITEADPIERG